MSEQAPQAAEAFVHSPDFQERINPAGAVAKRLAERGMRRIVVVDDSFDPPSRGDFEQSELEDFWTRLEADGLVDALSQFAGATVEGEEYITDELITRLNERSDVLNELQGAFDDHLRAALNRKHLALHRFTNSLVADLGLEVRKLGSDATLPDDWAQVLFVDFYLGERPDEGSVAASVNWVRRAMKAYPSGVPKPLIVLMSSDPNVKERTDEFRDRAEIIGGMFSFVPKTDLGDRVKLLMNLNLLAASLPVGRQIQQFVDAIEDQLDHVKGEFLAGMKRLSLDDYVFIQRLSLQREGHPFGDYLLWLLSAYFGHLLFETALGSKRRELDRLTFTDWTPSHAMPTAQLADMYHSALFDTNVGPLKHHPRAEIVKPVDAASEPLVTQREVAVTGGTRGEHDDRSKVATGIAERPNATDNSGAQPPSNAIADAGSKPTAVSPDPSTDAAVPLAGEFAYISLGDVFMHREEPRVLTVVNPECDLAFTPDVDDRLPDIDRSIVLIPGKLEPLSTPMSGENQPRTELFVWRDQPHRITWSPKKVISIEHGTFAQELARRGYERVARLRLPFALEIQHSFAATLTRVGVPVPPPFYRQLGVKIFRRSPDSVFEPLRVAVDDAVAFAVEAQREAPQCVLTMGLLRVLHHYMAEYAEGLTGLPPFEQGVLDADAEAKRAARQKKWLKKASTSRDNYVAWQELAKPIPLPARGEVVEHVDASVVIARSYPTDGRWRFSCVLLVQIEETL